MNIALIDAVGVSRSAVLTVAEAEGAVTVGPWAFVGLAVAIAVLIFLVLRTKIHALLALVIAASIAGLSAGMSPEDTSARSPPALVRPSPRSVSSSASAS